MARKEQLTITLDAELTKKLRERAQRQNASLSSVIESYLNSVDSLSGKTDIQRVLKILEDIQEAVVAKEEKAPQPHFDQRAIAD